MRLNNKQTLTPQSPFKALIFDCDGTMINSLPAHYQAWVETLKTFGVSITPELFHTFNGMSTIDIVVTLNRQFNTHLDPVAVGDSKEQRYGELLEKVTELTPVANVAREYYGMVPLAIASGSTKPHVTTTLDNLGLLKLFDTIVTAEDATNNKPCPDIFLVAACRLRVMPEDCIVYEDSDSGVEAAARAGMRVVDIRSLFSFAPLLRYQWPKET